MDTVEQDLFIEITYETCIVQQKEKIESNLLQLPAFFNLFAEPFLGVNHLNELYRESYCCTVYGQYHAGILLMSQLLEETLREIIRVHTGISHKGIFEDLISFVSGKGKKSPQPYLIHPELTKTITKIKDDIRNPYIHNRYDKIFGDKRIPGSFINISQDPQTVVQDIKKGIDEFKSGNAEIHRFNPAIEPTIAVYMKKELDKVRVFALAWQIYPLYALLLEEYLSKDDYNKSIQRFGSPLESLKSK